MALQRNGTTLPAVNLKIALTIKPGGIAAAGLFIFFSRDSRLLIGAAHLDEVV